LVLQKGYLGPSLEASIMLYGIPGHTVVNIGTSFTASIHYIQILIIKLTQ